MPLTKTVLVLEDDSFFRAKISENLFDRGINVLEAGTAFDAKKLLQTNGPKIDVALLDIRVPARGGACEDSPQGRRAGLNLAKEVRMTFPHIRLLGMSLFAEEEVRDWFHEYGYSFLRKEWLSSAATKDFIDIVENAARLRRRPVRMKSFIVHGHDNEAVYALARFVEYGLKWPRPLILRELPSHGKTIIEKFEAAAEKVDVVFVLLTPDDLAASAKSPEETKQRARQNVIFELGYFYAKLQRTGGRVLLLHRGKIELPSDIAGIIYIDFSHGIDSAGEEIRRELSNRGVHL